MAREVDERKTKRALSRLKRAREEAEARGETLSGWETEFVESVETRLKTFGSAFRDPEKGDLSEPLSGRQRQKAREIERKARGKTKDKGKDGATPKQRKPLRAKKPMSRGKGKTFTPRVRDIAEELTGEDTPETERTRYAGPPALRLIDGGE
jgi:hypothetical protein